MSALQLSSIISRNLSPVEAIEAVLEKNGIDFVPDARYLLENLHVDPSVRLNHEEVSRMTENSADDSTAKKMLRSNPILAFGDRKHAHVFVGALEVAAIKEGWERFRIKVSFVLAEEPSPPLKLLLAALAKNKAEVVPCSYKMVDWVSKFKFLFPFPFQNLYLQLPLVKDVLLKYSGQFWKTAFPIDGKEDEKNLWVSQHKAEICWLLRPDFRVPLSFWRILYVSEEHYPIISPILVCIRNSDQFNVFFNGYRKDPAAFVEFCTEVDVSEAFLLEDFLDRVKAIKKSFIVWLGEHRLNYSTTEEAAKDVCDDLPWNTESLSRLHNMASSKISEWVHKLRTLKRWYRKQ